MSCAASRNSRAAAVAVLVALAAGAAGAAGVAVEYFHAGYGHYFVTAAPDEIAALDAGRAAGWQRTGETFGVEALGAAGATGVCRFWSGQTFAPKSSHFYVAEGAECGRVQGNPDWTWEGLVFALRAPDADGACPSGMQPLYRSYNDGRGGAPNHRYVTKPGLRAEMTARGWVYEGVAGCVTGPPGPFVVAAAGDIGECRGRPAALSMAARTAGLVEAQDELVLTLGDHAYEDGTPQQFADCFDRTWGAFRDRIRPVPGNHDYNTPGGTGYFGYFGAQAGPDRRGYYSFDYRGWHFVALDSMGGTSAGSEQYRWLQDDLARSSALCTIAFWHHPRFNTGASYGDNAGMRPLFDLLQAAGVELLLSGHEHIYERFAPRTGDGSVDRARGVRQFVVGTGGHSLNEVGPVAASTEFRSNAHWGVLRLTLHPAHFDWQFVVLDNPLPLDAGTQACRR